jgi:RNA polymerase sigma-70 factor, ECF subfamily
VKRPAAEGSPVTLECLQAARAGSTAALGQLMEMCRQYLLGVANGELESQLQAKAGASDLVQDAFLEAQRIFSRFQGETSQELLAWLRAILLNKLADFNRAYRGTDKRQVAREMAIDGGPTPSAPGLQPAANVATPSGIVAQDEEAQAVQRALDRLPDHYRQVILWRQWEDMPFEEIARRLGKSVDAARMVWWRAIERLQQELGPTHE